jgi:epoxyqueuosine reductase
VAPSIPPSAPPSNPPGAAPAALPPAVLGEWLKERARAEGFEDAEIVPAAAPLPDAPRLKEAVDAGRLGPLDWMARTLDQRMDLKVRLPWARSVLVVLASYYPGDHEDHLPAEELAARARVSRYAWGQDYHHVLRRRLRRLRKALLERAGGGRCAPFNDVDAVLERGWAHAAGLGFIGKSAMLIHRGLGTWTFIGGLVTDLDLGPRRREPMTDLCGTCTACLDACPTAAIVAPRTVDARRCLVTWNVEEPQREEGEAPGMVGHGWAVGCDVCQEVCPWNRFEKKTSEERFLPKGPAAARHVAFSPEEPPLDVEGTPLARPGREALPLLAARALKKRSG